MPAALKLLFGTTLITLIFAEIMLRLFWHSHYMPPPTHRQDSEWTDQLTQKSTIPGLNYELAANADITFEGIRYRTNELGMRDGPLTCESPPACTPILLVGDSYFFGLGLDYDSTIGIQLEKLMALKSPWHGDIINMAVSGYSTQDSAKLLHHRGLDLKPKVIVMGYYLNDPETDPVQPVHSYFHEASWWQYVEILRLSAQVHFAWQVLSLGEGSYHRYLHHPQGEKWQNTLVAMDEIQRDAASIDARVLWVIFPDTPSGDWSAYQDGDLHQQVAAAAKERGFEVLDLLPIFAQQPPDELKLSATDSHPNEQGAFLAAKAIGDLLYPPETTLQEQP